MEPHRFISRPVHTDNHRGHHVGRFQRPGPLPGQMTVTGEHDGVRRFRRQVDRDGSAAVVLEPVGNERTSGGADGHLVIHGLTRCVTGAEVRPVHQTT